MCSKLFNKDYKTSIPVEQCSNGEEILSTIKCKNIEECKQASIFNKKTDQLPSGYLEQNIFPLLLPAIEETLIEASKWNALRVQKCRFNGLDYIAQLLWNLNPRRSKIYSPMLNVFDIPVFKEYLLLHPRPYYPKSWLWSEEHAALRIQRYVRGWLVRKREDVQEMRQFWKVVAGKDLSSASYKSQEMSDKEQELKVTRCEKYRSMFLKRKTRRTKVQSDLTLFQ